MKHQHIVVNREPMTDLDRRLQELAVMNWPQFKKIMGDKAITLAKVCLLRRDNRSYGEISQKLGINTQQVRYRCETCTMPELLNGNGNGKA